jgi:hypothetical protein
MKKLVVTFILSMVMGISDLLAQCSMCRTTIENNVSAGDTALGSGLNLGILYLFVTPYLVFGVIAFFWYKKSRENAKKVAPIGYSK